MANVAIEDLSGHATRVTENPFDGLIEACQGDVVGTFSYSSGLHPLSASAETHSRPLCSSSHYQE